MNHYRHSQFFFFFFPLSCDGNCIINFFLCIILVPFFLLLLLFDTFPFLWMRVSLVSLDIWREKKNLYLQLCISLFVFFPLQSCMQCPNWFDSRRPPTYYPIATDQTRPDQTVFCSVREYPGSDVWWYIHKLYIYTGRFCVYPPPHQTVGCVHSMLHTHIHPIRWKRIAIYKLLFRATDDFVCFLAIFSQMFSSLYWRLAIEFHRLISIIKKKRMPKMLLFRIGKGYIETPIGESLL